MREGATGTPTRTKPAQKIGEPMEDWEEQDTDEILDTGQVGDMTDLEYRNIVREMAYDIFTSHQTAGKDISAAKAFTIAEEFYDECFDRGY